MSLTDEQIAFWKACGMRERDVFNNLRDWAEMLERRVAELDPDYRAYQFGRTPTASPAEPV